MRSWARSTWFRRLTALTAVAAILLATDSRAAHQAGCTKPADLCDVAAEPATAPDPCCPRPADPGDPQTSVCLDFDDCGCCSHAPHGHPGEADTRAVAEVDVLDFSWFLATLVAPIGLIEPLAPAWVMTQVDHPIPAASIHMLLGRLLI